jgi:NAD kinase
MQSTLGITIVTRPTRLEGLRQKWGTVGQAKFLLRAAHAHADLAAAEAAAKLAAPATRQRWNKNDTADKAVVPRNQAMVEVSFGMYEHEEIAYQSALDQLQQDLDFGLPVKVLDRSFVPNFDFSRSAVVVVLGQDGLVANTAKYVGDLPIVAVNPDPERIDGVLLPFQIEDGRRTVASVLDGRYHSRSVTLAEVNLNDGQRMLAFNDFFVGASSHISARYTIHVGDAAEPHSSSGVLVSTGAGSTGWMSSVFNMAAGVAHVLGGDVENRIKLDWEDRRLLWAVREPFVSKASQATLVAGTLAEGDAIELESLMPSGGVIFSDGIENDFLQFNTGTIARIAASQQRARLVVA